MRQGRGLPDRRQVTSPSLLARSPVRSRIGPRGMAKVVDWVDREMTPVRGQSPAGSRDGPTTRMIEGDPQHRRACSSPASARRLLRGGLVSQ